MKVIAVSDYEKMSRLGAETIMQVIKQKPNCVLGLATGSTPIRLYELLVQSCKEGEISFKNVKTVNLDEYIGLGVKDEQSYAYFMNDNLFDHVDIDKANTHLPDGKNPDGDEACAQYTKLLEANVQDIQLLGLGTDGHIGFNEPGSPFDGHTHIVDLAESTIKDNSRLFASIDEVPKKAITMGIADIMQAKTILIMASGKNKAQAVYNMVNGEVTQDCPASILQTHDDVWVVLDREAASLLNL